MDIQKIVVCGAGVMGGGIAQVCANAGYEVWMYDLTEAFAQGGKNKIAAGLEKQVARGKMTVEQKEALLSRLHPTTDIACAADAQLVMEAVLENIQVKKDLFSKLEAVCPADTIIGTNTSYIPISTLAEDLIHPERFLGMHFFNPVYAMKLLEIIRGEKTGDAAFEAALAFAPTIGKTPVSVKKEVPGFIVNRLNKAVQAEAMYLLHEGVASVEDIDKAAKLGLNYPMGPFEMMDGNLELTYTCLNLLYELTGDARFQPTEELKAHIEAGEFGRRTGKGWYDYTEQ